jgi:hypothetical protein
MVLKKLNTRTPLYSKFASLLIVAIFSGALLVSGEAVADAATGSMTGSATTTTSSASGSTTKSSTAKKQADLQEIISKGNQEIERRLTTLSTLTSKINAATKLTPSNKTTLSNEVSSTTTGLTSLKTQLDADTTVSSAYANAVSIYTEYRVYAIVAPKVGLIKVADDQQVVQSKLSTLAQKLQTRITTEQKAGKDVSSLQTELNDMTTKTSAAQAISSNVESTVINLQPSDYNSNHAVLSGDNTQLKTAHSDDQAAYTDAKNIVSSLKSM